MNPCFQWGVDREGNPWCQLEANHDGDCSPGRPGTIDDDLNDLAGHEHVWDKLTISSTIVHRTCRECREVEEDVFVAQGHVVTVGRSGLGGLLWRCTCGATGATANRADAYRHVESDKGVVIADAGHTFRISVEVRGSSKVRGDKHHSDEREWDPIPQVVEVRAWSLREALEKAAALPFATWFETEEDDDA